MTERIFEERQEQSEAKDRIVTKYFSAWACVIMPSAQRNGGKITYIDLYAGPGRYKDSAASTPLLVLQTAIDHPQMSHMLVSYFNDVENNNIKTLEQEIPKLPSIETLKYSPIIRCGEIDDEAEQYFSQTQLISAFSFVDSFGYKGLSLKIVKGVINDWGCDCVFFFNYNRINAGITNDNVSRHIDALFCKARANKLRRTLPGRPPQFREAAILEALAHEIKDLGGQYVLPFTFKNSSGTLTSNPLASKNFLTALP